MRVPFLHTSAAALHLTDTHVVWASGTRLGHRLRQLHTESEPVVDGDMGMALQRLIKKVKPAQPHVVTHLNAQHVRYAILQGPAFDDAALFEAWLRAETVRRLPPRVDQEDFVVRYQFIEETDDYTRCLLALTSRKAVEERIALLEGVGLRPVRLGSLDIAFGEALMLDPVFIEHQGAVLVVHSGEAFLLMYEAGLLQTLASIPLSVKATDHALLLQDVATHLTPRPDRFLVMGNDAPRLIELAREARLIEGVIQEGTLDFLSQAKSLSAHHRPAAMLALQHLYATPETLNFLEPARVGAQVQEMEKHEATRAILLLGSVLGVLLLILILITAYLSSKKADSEAELLMLADQVARIEQANESVRQLEHDMVQAERLVVERTTVARVLEGIGHVAEAELWLETLMMETDPSGVLHVNLMGAGLNERIVAAYLDRLEQMPFAVNVRLLVSERISMAKMYRHGKGLSRTVTRFEIQLERRPGPTRPEEGLEQDG